MIKAARLRHYLETAIPRLKDNAQALKVYVEQGGVAAVGAPGKAWEYRFRLELIFEDMPASELDAVTGALLAWIEINQPSLLAPVKDGQAFDFEAEFLDAKTLDLSIKLPLTEGVRLDPREGGKFEAVHLDEPRPETVYGQLEEVFANGSKIIDHRWAHEP
jgi:hypothetical protein